MHNDWFKASVSGWMMMGNIFLRNEVYIHIFTTSSVLTISNLKEQAIFSFIYVFIVLLLSVVIFEDRSGPMFAKKNVEAICY